MALGRSSIERDTMSLLGDMIASWDQASCLDRGNTSEEWTGCKALADLDSSGPRTTANTMHTLAAAATSLMAQLGYGNEAFYS